MNSDSMIKRKEKKFIIYAAIVLAGLSFVAHADTAVQNASTTISTSSLMNESVFNESQESSVMVHPEFSDSSTNIAFYAECPVAACPDTGTLASPVFVFFAENLGQGDLPFSSYWAPDPSLHNFVAIEYVNDKQQFSCSSLSLDDCIADAHFISQFSFQIGDGNTTATSSAPTVANSTIQAVSTTTLADAMSVAAASSTTPIIGSDVIVSTSTIATSTIDIVSTTTNDTDTTSTILSIPTTTSIAGDEGSTTITADPDAPVVVASDPAATTSAPTTTLPDGQ